MIRQLEFGRAWEGCLHLLRMTALCFVLCGWLGPAVADEVSFFALSDLHWDPFLSCKSTPRPCPLIQQLVAKPVVQWSQVLAADKVQSQHQPMYTQDTQDGLWQVVLQQLQQRTANKAFSFVVVTGDFLGHRFHQNYRDVMGSDVGYQAFVTKVFHYLYQGLVQASGGDHAVYFVMGNNDGFGDDYWFKLQDPFFSMIADTWGKATMMSSAFITRGEYRFPITANLFGLVLNSNLYEKKTRGDKHSAAQASLDYLESQLQLAKAQGEQLILFYHIPFGIDPRLYLFPEAVRRHWTWEESERFLQLMRTYPNEIMGIVHGHLHRDLFAKAQRDRSLPLPQWLVPSVSPIFGNGPQLVWFHSDGHHLQRQLFAVMAESD